MKRRYFSTLPRDEKGIAMILAIGALAVITVVALGFCFNTQTQYKASLNYMNALKVRYIAESGIERSIADLKADAGTRFVYEKSNLNIVSADWSTSASITDMAFDAGKYSVTVDDEQSKININTASQTLLQNAGFTAQQASDIINYRTTYNPFFVVEELKKVASIDDITYNAKAGFLTVNSYMDANSSNRAPVNINTASDQVLIAVVENLSSGASSISAGDADLIKDSIKSKRPIKAWSDFNNAVDLSGIDPAKREIVKNNCNPNRDKSALSSATTEFCFFSGGYYTIQSSAMIGDKYASRVKAVVKIYEMKNESTSADFLNTGAILKNVNASDLCPVGAGTIPNSMKIGYFDDFSVNKEWVLSASASIGAGALITPSGDTAILSLNPGKYSVDTSDVVSVNVNGTPSGPVKMPYIFYSSDGPPPQTIGGLLEGSDGKSLKLYAINCSAKWDNLRIVTGSGTYTTRQYSVSDAAEQPVVPVIYGTITKTLLTDGSTINLSYSIPSSDKVRITADFSNPNYASTAAVLEDIWFTYLPRAKFLYWQEG